MGCAGQVPGRPGFDLALAVGPHRPILRPPGTCEQPGPGHWRLGRQRGFQRYEVIDRGQEPADQGDQREQYRRGNRRSSGEVGTAGAGFRRPNRGPQHRGNQGGRFPDPPLSGTGKVGYLQDRSTSCGGIRSEGRRAGHWTGRGDGVDRGSHRGHGQRGGACPPCCPGRVRCGDGR